MFCTAKEGFLFLLSSNKMVWRCVPHCLQSGLPVWQKCCKISSGVFTDYIYTYLHTHARTHTHYIYARKFNRRASK